jgi:serine/threonine protein kinase
MAFEQANLLQVDFLHIYRPSYALRISRLKKLSVSQLQKYEDDVGGFEDVISSLGPVDSIKNLGSLLDFALSLAFFRRDAGALHSCLRKAEGQLGSNHPFVADLKHDVAAAMWAFISVNESEIPKDFRNHTLQESRRLLTEFLSGNAEDEFQPNQFKSEELLAIIQFELGIFSAVIELLSVHARRRVELFGFSSLETRGCVLYLAAALANTSQDLEQIQEMCTSGIANVVEDNEEDNRFRTNAMAILLNIAETHHRAGNASKGDSVFEVLRDVAASHWGMYHWKTTEIMPYLAHVRMLNGRPLEAESEVFTAWISESVTLGQLHERTLRTMLAYGGLLMSLSRLEEARVLLEECLFGFLSWYSGNTPLVKRVGQMLNAIYSKIRRSTRDLSDFDPSCSALQKASWEKDFERHSIADMVALINGFTQRYDLATSILRSILPIMEMKEGRSLKPLRIKRATAIFFQLQNDSVQARAFMDAHMWEGMQRLSESGVETARELIITWCDHVTILSQIPMWEYEASKAAQNLFFDLVKEFGDEDPRTTYYHSKMTKFGLNHWNFTDSAAPFVITRKLGQGSYGAVNEVACTVPGATRKTFAQKLIWIRRNRESILEIVQNEVTIIRALHHPHIVRIYYTYEESDHFSVLFEPVAELDLEAYLDQFNSEMQLNDTSRMGRTKRVVSGWYYCLASTLAFIHENGVRHKDIKTSNILIKGENVIFADFGSSHAFASELTSSSEGAPFGHTRMFCAPEVISESTRGRSADIFSLGCVFAEMASVARCRRPADFHKFRVKKEKGGFKGETHAYHATLDLVDEWLSEWRPAIPPGGNERAPSPYNNFIKPMLLAAREDRPSATTVADLVKSYFGDYVAECTYCHPRISL